MASDFETFFIFKRRNIELFLFPRDFNFLGNLISLGISVSFWFSREVYKIHECVGGYTRLCVGVYKPIILFDIPVKTGFRLYELGSNG